MSFVKKIKNKKYASQDQKNIELWDVEGILHNQTYKFDLRPIKNDSKRGLFNTKADKMVFDMKNKWVIVDIEELHTYIKEHKLNVVQLEDLILKLEWNIILPK